MHILCYDLTNLIKICQIKVCHYIIDPTNTMYNAQKCVSQSSFRWIYYYGSNKSTRKETGKSHLCAIVWCGPLSTALSGGPLTSLYIVPSRGKSTAAHTIFRFGSMLDIYPLKTNQPTCFHFPLINQKPSWSAVFFVCFLYIANVSRGICRRSEETLCLLGPLNSV